MGTKAGTAGRLIGVQRVHEFFVAGCDLETTKEKLSEYCAENGVTIKKCEALPTKALWYTCFKLSVVQSFVDIIMDGNFWPEGVFVRQFFTSRYNRRD